MSTWLKKLESIGSQRLLAVALVWAQCFIIWRLMEGTMFAALAFVLAAGALVARPARMLPHMRFELIAAGALILFLAKARTAPHFISLDHAFMYSEQAYEVVCAIVSLQLVLLWMSTYREQLPVSFVALGGLGIIFLGDVRTNDGERAIYGMVVSLAVLLLALIAITGRRPAASNHRSSVWRTGLIAFPILAGTLLGQTGAGLLSRNEQHFERFFAEYIEERPRDVCTGFTGEAGLESMSMWNHYDEDVLMLRVKGAGKPTYLRGCTFRMLEDNRWQMGETFLPLRGSSASAVAQYTSTGDLVHELNPLKNSDGLEVIDVWPETGAGGQYCLMPHETNVLIAPPGTYSRDASGIVRREADTPEVPYRLLIDPAAPPTQITAVEREQCLTLSEKTDERVFRISDEVFAGCEGSTAKIRAVQQFFHKNFQYQFGIQIPRGQNRLAYFLEHRLSAHCEYFASATAIMLRTQGIPTRFVTGYVAGEWNPAGGFWIARRKDAHAWVEAYDDEQGRWVIVESTPSAGVPQPRETAGASAWTSSLSLAFIRLQNALMRVEWNWILGFGLGTSLLVSLFYFAFKMAWVPWKWSWFGPQEAIACDASLIRERISLDKLLRRKGLIRLPHETIRQFASRIEREIPGEWGKQAALCYEAYAQMRFGPPSPESGNQLASMRQALANR